MASAETATRVIVRPIETGAVPTQRSTIVTEEFVVRFSREFVQNIVGSVRSSLNGPVEIGVIIVAA